MPKQHKTAAQYFYLTLPVLALGLSFGMNNAYGDAQPVMGVASNNGIDASALEWATGLNQKIRTDVLNSLSESDNGSAGGLNVPDAAALNLEIRQNLDLGIAHYDPETGGFIVDRSFLPVELLNGTLGDSIRESVRDSLSVASTPLPAAVWLFGSGLIGLFAWRRRRG